MVVNSKKLELSHLDLGHLALFLGLRVNELVVAQMKRKGFSNLRESHGYLIQHLIDSERSITDLARRMGVTQQAASKSVAELVRLGVLEESRGEDRRSKTIRLSGKGWDGVRTSRQVRRKIDGRLRSSLGDLHYEHAAEILIRCLERLGGAERILARRVREPN